MKCKFCNNEMIRTGEIKADYYGGIYIQYKCNNCDIQEFYPEGYKQGV